MSCDDMVGLISMVCRERHRDPLRDGDYTFSAASRSTYMASQLGLSVVMADAAMVERVISVDVSEAAHGRYTGAPSRHGAYMVPDARDVESMGGRFWYEAA